MKVSKEKIIFQYIKLKRAESRAAEAVRGLKPLFNTAMESFPNGVTFGQVVIYSRECKKYEYSRVILAAEKRLAALKAAFEKKNAPIETVISWSVKL